MNNNDIFNFVDKDGGWSMSDFQSRYFVVNSQVTDYRRVKQALLEVETRLAAKKQIERSSRKTEIQMKIFERDYAAETDELKKEMIKVDIDQCLYDLSVYEKKYKVCLEELEIFANLIKEIVPDTTTLETYKLHNEEEEKKYWIARMAKQAAMDLAATGRIGQGNLDSIVMMPLDVQAETIKGALKYNGLLNRGIGILEKDALTDLSQSNTIGLEFVEHLIDSHKRIEGKVRGEDV